MNCVLVVLGSFFDLELPFITGMWYNVIEITFQMRRVCFLFTYGMAKSTKSLRALDMVHGLVPIPKYGNGKQQLRLFDRFPSERPGETHRGSERSCFPLRGGLRSSETGRGIVPDRFSCRYRTNRFVVLCADTGNLLEGPCFPASYI